MGFYSMMKEKIVENLRDAGCDETTLQRRSIEGAACGGGTSVTSYLDQKAAPEQMKETQEVWELKKGLY